MDEIRKETTFDVEKIFLWAYLCRFIVSHHDTSAIHSRNRARQPIWLVLSFLFVIFGELCLSPVGLSATTKLAPASFSAQTMSLWFLSNAAAQGINAQIVKFFSFDHEVLYFGVIGSVAIIFG